MEEDLLGTADASSFDFEVAGALENHSKLNPAAAVVVVVDSPYK
jgi:hypothetical protein